MQYSQGILCLLQSKSYNFFMAVQGPSSHQLGRPPGRLKGGVWGGGAPPVRKKFELVSGCPRSAWYLFFRLSFAYFVLKVLGLTKSTHMFSYLGLAYRCRTRSFLLKSHFSLWRGFILNWPPVMYLGHYKLLESQQVSVPKQTHLRHVPGPLKAFRIQPHEFPSTWTLAWGMCLGH